jgi:hypothetical protein
LCEIHGERGLARSAGLDVVVRERGEERLDVVSMQLFQGLPIPRWRRALRIGGISS